MKTKLLMILMLTVIGGTAYAETIKVEAITPFSTENPPHSVQLRSMDEIQITKKVKIHTGDILTGSLTDIKDPKRLKRDATFKFEIKTITNAQGETKSVKENNIARYVSPLKLDKKELAKDAALMVGNHFVEGLSLGYRAIEGAVDSEENGALNRTTSAVENVYNHSILSCINKGEELVINQGDIFGLKINSEEEIEEYETEHAPNYTYELPQAQ